MVKQPQDPATMGSDFDAEKIAADLELIQIELQYAIADYNQNKQSATAPLGKEDVKVAHNTLLATDLAVRFMLGGLAANAFGPPRRRRA